VHRSVAFPSTFRSSTPAEVLRNWVAIERQFMPEIVAACLRDAGELAAV